MVRIDANFKEKTSIDEFNIFFEGGEGEDAARGREWRPEERERGLEEEMDCSSSGEGDGEEGMEKVRGEE